MKAIIVAAILAASAHAQTSDYGRTFRGVMDANQATRTRPFRHVSSVPTSGCSSTNAGETVYFTTGFVLYKCDGTSWSILTSGGGSGYATIQGNGSAVAQRATVDFLSGFGVTMSVADAGGGTKTTVTPGVDDTVIATRAQAQLATDSRCDATGTNTYACTASAGGVAFAAYPASFLFCPTNANTGASTIALSALTARTLQRWGGAALSSGDITAGACYSAVNQASSYWLQGVGVSGSSTSLPVAELQMNFGECDNNGAGVVARYWSKPSTGTGATVSCPGAAPHGFAWAAFAATGSDALEKRIMLPAGWSGASPIVVLRLGESGNFGTGNVAFTVSVTCISDGVNFNNPTLNTAGTTGSVAVSTSSGTGSTNKQATITSIPTTGCTAGTSNWAVVRIARDNTVSGNYASPMNALSMVMRFPQ